MAFIHCPECNRQVSDKAPNCPQCGYPLAGNSHRPPPQQISIQKSPGLGAGVGKAFGCLITVGVAAFLAFTNPTEADMRQRIAKDGWAPVSFERTNLVLCNWVSVHGFTGAKAKYLGIGGMIFKIKEE